MTHDAAPEGAERPGDPRGLRDRVGGLEYFEALVAAFYVGIAEDPLLRPMYPEDLGPAERRLALFFDQYWGGPPVYSENRGHPRLRMRHGRFVVDEAAEATWLRLMAAAIDTTPAAGAPLHPADRELLWNYVTTAAAHLRNS